MRYNIRPGISHIKVCGVHLLVPNREASENCKEIMQLKLTGAITWELIENGRTIEDIYQLYRVLSKKDPEVVQKRVDSFLDDLCEKGFLIRVEKSGL